MNLTQSYIMSNGKLLRNYKERYQRLRMKEIYLECRSE